MAYILLQDIILHSVLKSLEAPHCTKRYVLWTGLKHTRILNISLPWQKAPLTEHDVFNLILVCLHTWLWSHSVLANKHLMSYKTWLSEIQLLLNFFPSPSPDRMAEFLFCFKRQGIISLLCCFGSFVCLFVWGLFVFVFTFLHLRANLSYFYEFATFDMLAFTTTVPPNVYELNDY